MGLPTDKQPKLPDKCTVKWSKKDLKRFDKEERIRQQIRQEQRPRIQGFLDGLI
jgi:hypothetical protein